MQTVVGVRFKQAGKVYYFGTGGMDLKYGDEVIAETVRGLEYGKVLLPPKEIEDAKVTLPLRAVIRLASDEDRKKVAENKEKEKEAFDICARKIAERGLAMKLVNVEYTFDVNKIVFYFTAEGRIDFRELVKDLAAIFRTRIELRQIGVRDEAKMMGGIGCCGRSLCCATFLDEFVPVSIRMAKEQSLSLNPTKISGICGRLMCCLKYENDCYVSRRKERRKIQAPKPGCRVATMEGDGKVISISEQRCTATILLDDSKTIVAAWEDIVEKDEEAVTPEEMAAAIAVATMLNEGEQAAQREGAAENRHGRRERDGEGRRTRRKDFRENREGREGREGRSRGPRGPRPERGENRSRGEGRERRESRGDRSQRDSRSGDFRPQRGPRPERFQRTHDNEHNEIHDNRPERE